MDQPAAPEKPSIGGPRRAPARDTTAISAALLNASGLGAGYVYLGQWADLVIYWIGVTVWAVFASFSVVWMAVIALWIAMAVANAWDTGLKEAQRDRHRERRRPWLAVVAGVVLLAVVVAGLVVVYRAGARSELTAGDDAHAEGNCEEAIDHYDRVTSMYRISFTSAVDRAADRRRACERLLEAEDSTDAGDVGFAVSAYESYLEMESSAVFADGAAAELATARSQYAQELVEVGGEEGYLRAYDQYVRLVEDHPDSPEAASAPGDVQAMYEAATVDLAEGRNCEVLGTLELFAGFPGNDGLSDGVVVRAQESLPVARLGCEAQQIQEEIELLRPGSAELPPPTPSGSAPGGTVTVEIINGSRQPLELLYTGPATGRGTLEACGDCEDSTGLLPETTCGTANSPRRTLTLPAGSFQMLVMATGDDVSPFYGTWDLASGTAYSDCYYIRTTF